MDKLNIAENIMRFRNEKRITQEQLADFIGVTKASVSKWETGKSMPDIVILPKLASFFDVTVDELIGYVPQLSKEQIRRLYQELAAEFVDSAFEDVMARTQTYVKRYYSCYPLLFQICVLWLNHYSLAEGEKRQNEILCSIVELCEHIKENCRDIGIADDVIVLQAIALLQLRRSSEVIDMLEESSKPYRLREQSGGVLIQAYMAEGELDKAESFTQISIYNAVMSLIGIATGYLSMHLDNLAACEPTIERIEQVAAAFDISKLNPNSSAGFEYQAAMCFAMHGEKKRALVHTERYVSCLQELFAPDQIYLHGDAYFNKIEEWFEEMGTNTPRDRKLVLDEGKQSLANPVFHVLEGEAEFERIKKKLEAIR